MRYISLISYRDVTYSSHLIEFLTIADECLRHLFRKSKLYSRAFPNPMLCVFHSLKHKPIECYKGKYFERCELAIA